HRPAIEDCNLHPAASRAAVAIDVSTPADDIIDGVSWPRRRWPTGRWPGLRPNPRRACGLVVIRPLRAPAWAGAVSAEGQGQPVRRGGYQLIRPYPPRRLRDPRVGPVDRPAGLLRVLGLLLRVLFGVEVRSPPPQAQCLEDVHSPISA